MRILLMEPLSIDSSLLYPHVLLWLTGASRTHMQPASNIMHRATLALSNLEVKREYWQSGLYCVRESHNALLRKLAEHCACSRPLDLLSTGSTS